MRYNDIILENQLLFTVDIIKEHLDEAYQKDSPAEMKKMLENAVTECPLSGNKHLIWFACLLTSHMEGIIGYAKYPISPGKMEGINGHIKEIRRHGYDYPDDEYFFLKLIDASRHVYVRYSKSHKITY